MSQYLWFSLFFYKVYMKRENAASWNSGLEKEQILETYSAQLQKSWNFTGACFRIYKKYWAKEVPEGGHPPSTRVGGVPIFCYMKSFTLEKNHKQAYGTKLRRHEAEPWRNQSRAPTELFYRGNFPPGGGNHHHRHHQRSSHRERAISINIFTSTISSPNPSSSLVSNLVSKTINWYLWIASSVDYSL